MIITLCGSARFEPWFHAWKRGLGLAGHACFDLCVYPSQMSGRKNWYTDDQKKMLDKVHFTKIKNSHAILVLNAFAYIGESTINEIRCAQAAGCTLYSLESWGEDCGIDHNHTADTRVEAWSIRMVPERYRSPLDLSHGGKLDAHYPGDLLPPDGEGRQAIIDVIRPYGMEDKDVGKARRLSIERNGFGWRVG